MLIKVHWFIGKIKRYYSLIRKAYKIITEKFENIKLKLLRLQIVIKAINNIANFNNFIFTLLVFGVYLRININLPFTFTQT